MEYKLICTDIDGTLLNDNKKLLPEVKDSLRRASDMGIRIALVSGRMPSGVEVVEKMLGIDCIKVCNAGTYILMGDRCLGSFCLPIQILHDIDQNIAKKHGIPLWIFLEREWYVTGTDAFIEKEIGYVSYTPQVVDAKELAGNWEREGKSPNKLLVAAPPQEIQNIHGEIAGLELPSIDMACSADTFLEIFPIGIHKGTALKTICRELGIDAKQTIAFGDHELDIPLIEAAGMGVAMGNAIGALKERADFVTKPNREVGIAYALEMLL